MSKNVKIKVTSAFVYGGKIRTPGKIVEMPEADAKPILEREKAVVSNGGDDADTGSAKGAKKAAKPAKAQAKPAQAPAASAQAPAAAGAASNQD